MQRKEAMKLVPDSPRMGNEAGSELDWLEGFEACRKIMIRNIRKKFAPENKSRSEAK